MDVFTTGISFENNYQSPPSNIITNGKDKNKNCDFISIKLMYIVQAIGNKAFVSWDQRRKLIVVPKTSVTINISILTIINKKLVYTTLNL